jgi:hypothetical protein
MAELEDLRSYAEDIEKALDTLEHGIEQLYMKKSPSRNNTARLCRTPGPGW